MRVRISFSLINPKAIIPFFHQDLIDAFVKFILNKSDAYEHSENYNFSGIKGKTEVVNGGLRLLTDKITIVFSSPDKSLIDYFLNSIFERKFHTIGNLQITPISVDKEKGIPEQSSAVKYICISPLAIQNPIENGNINFIDPASDEFSDRIYESTMLRMENSELYSLEEFSTFNKFQLVPDAEYLARFLKLDNRKFSRLQSTKIMGIEYEVRAYSFPFTLFADSKVHEFIFNSGLGELTSHGLGMVDLADLAGSERSKPYNVSKFCPTFPHI